MRTWKLAGLSDFNYCWHAVVGGTGGGGGGGARYELKMFHEQILFLLFGKLIFSNLKNY